MDHAQKTEDHRDQDNHPTVIYVNTREASVTGKVISFAQIMALAFETPPTGPDVVVTVVYRLGHSEKPEGSLTEGNSVRLKKGMSFIVTATNKS